MELKLFNTLTRKVERFVPREDQKVGMYACGPTVYDFAHVGNLRTFIFEDVLRRTLEYFGYAVKQVMNLTDVGHLTSNADEGEDKLAVSARREGKTAWEIAAFYTERFLEDIRALNIKTPHFLPKATDHIAEQIELVKKLEARGYTYVIPGDGVYFDTSKLLDYGQLARLDVAKLRAGARVPLALGKKNITDFALWKFSRSGLGLAPKRDMEWESPWGRGFPGWHLECSAMSMKYLGEQFDIHTGGVDHIAVHHTNEIAQSEAATGKKPWVKYWLHGEFLVLKDAEKMSKSKKNFFTLRDLTEKGIEPLAFRYFILGAHYRKPLTFSLEALEGAQAAFDRLKQKILELKQEGEGGAPDVRYLDKFEAVMADDLNTPEALAALWQCLQDQETAPEARLAAALRFDEILGLGLADFAPEEISIPAEVEKLLEAREELRQRQKWEEADILREKIEELGFEIDDTSAGPRLKRGDR